MKLSDIKYLKLGLTTKCNSHCLTCWHSNANQMPPLIDMNENLYQHVSDRLFEHIEILDLLSGGEIFSSSLIDRFLSDISRRSFKTIIESNFAIIKETHRKILKDLDVRFIVSLDGSHRELQEYLRPQCYYEEVIRNIKFFVGCHKRVNIRMTVSNHNFYDMEKMLRLAEELKVDGVIFHGVQPLGCLERPYKFTPPPADMGYVNSIIRKKYKVTYDLFLDFYRRNSIFTNPMKGFYCVLDPITAQGAGLGVKFENLWRMVTRQNCCPVSRNFINIHVDGDMYFCSCHECKSVGDLRKNTLEEILENDRCDQMRKSCSCKISKRYMNASQRSQAFETSFN